MPCFVPAHGGGVCFVSDQVKLMAQSLLAQILAVRIWQKIRVTSVRIPMYNMLENQGTIC
jgi:hypothetical protein